MSKNDITGDNITSKLSNNYANNFGERKTCGLCGFTSHYRDNFVVSNSDKIICNGCFQGILIKCDGCD